MNSILITTSSFDAGLAGKIEKAGFKPVLNPFKRKLTEEEITNLIGTYSPVGMIAGIEPLTEAVLKSASGLKVISRCGTGMDSVDLKAAAKLGITVRNTPDAPTVPVAEFTVGLIFSLIRQITQSDRDIRLGGWGRLTGVLLREKTVGLIGCGRIGTEVSRLLMALGCKVIGFDPFLKQHNYAELVTLDELLIRSDIVSLHIPFSEENRHLLGKDAFAKMKPGAFVINAARGGLVDETALAEALSSGHLAGAAIDSFETEPYAKGPLAQYDTVILTAHLGSSAKEARKIMEEQSVTHLLEELK